MELSANGTIVALNYDVIGAYVYSFDNEPLGLNSVLYYPELIKSNASISYKDAITGEEISHRIFASYKHLDNANDAMTLSAITPDGYGKCINFDVVNKTHAVLSEDDTIAYTEYFGTEDTAGDYYLCSRAWSKNKQKYEWYIGSIGSISDNYLEFCLIDKLNFSDLTITGEWAMKKSEKNGEKVQTYGSTYTETYIDFDYPINTDQNTGIPNITDPDGTTPFEFYNMQGQRLETPIKGQIYIERQGASVKKKIAR